MDTKKLAQRLMEEQPTPLDPNFNIYQHGEEAINPVIQSKLNQVIHFSQKALASLQNKDYERVDEYLGYIQDAIQGADTAFSKIPETSIHG